MQIIDLARPAMAPEPTAEPAPAPAPAYRLRLASGAEDVARCLALRSRVFRHSAGTGAAMTGAAGAADGDAHDADCHHLLVEVQRSGDLAGTCRAMPLRNGADAARRAYSAQYYGLAPWAGIADPMLEIGRFCAADGHHAPEVLRLIWAGLAALALGQGARFLFGCASFAGAEPDRHAPALGWLAAHALAAPARRPTRRARATLHLSDLPAHATAPRLGALSVPPLLRGYLGLGARVSDHAVIDHELDTIHVLTLLDVADIAPARARMLRALAARVAPQLAGAVPPLAQGTRAIGCP